MKWCIRSTLGVIIGIINVVVYIFGLYVSISIYNYVNNDIFLIIPAVFVIMITLSALLIIGIVMKFSMFIWPWLAVSTSLFLCYCATVSCLFVEQSINGKKPFLTLIMVSLTDVLKIGIIALSLWLVCSLWKDAGLRNNEKTGLVLDYKRFISEGAYDQSQTNHGSYLV